jgi:preprotein translocase subunit YajC
LASGSRTATGLGEAGCATRPARDRRRAVNGPRASRFQEASIFMFITPAFAQAGTAQPGGLAATIGTFAPMLLIFVGFYFLIMRPQQQRAKAHRAKLDAVRKGDQVVTGGGLLGKVTRVEDDAIEVELAPNVRVRALKSTLSDVTGVGTSKPAND